jgi:hypothetical protein
MWPSRHVPEPDDVEDRLLENEKGDEFFLPELNDADFQKSKQRNLWWTWVLQGAIFFSSLTLFVFSRYSEPSDAACTRKLFAYCSLTHDEVDTISKLTCSSTCLRSCRVPRHNLPGRF